MKAIVLFISAFLLTACATGLVERDGLPTGVTLLESFDGTCRTDVYIEDDVLVNRGESKVIELDENRPLDWECMADPAADTFDIDCPAGTDYIRVINGSDSDRFTVECFG